MPRTGNDHLDLQELYETLMWINPAINPDLGKIEPPSRYRRTGLIAYADGTNWNPGSGSGHYFWDGSAWIKYLQNPYWYDSGSLGAATTTIGPITLDFTKHKSYRIESRLVANSASVTAYNYYYNNDTTSSNYGRHQITVAGTTVGADNDNNPAPDETSAIGNFILLTGDIAEYTSNRVMMLYSMSKKATTNVYKTGSIYYTVTTSPVTRLDITASVSNGIAAGSRVILWANLR